MGRNKDNFEIENLEEWANWLEDLDDKYVDRFKDRVLRSAGLRALEITQDFTPVRSGRLAGSFNFGDKDNVFMMKVGKTSYVVWGTTVKYVRYVEEGFEQNEGRFVPGFWKNGVFHYIPDYEAGMVLTGAKVQGAHMIQKGLDGMKEDLDDIVEFEFRRLYAELEG